METSTPAVVLDRLTKTYSSGAGNVAALRGVTYAFSRGSFTAVMGASGSGKSTLLQCAAGLDRPASGLLQPAQLAQMQTTVPVDEGTDRLWPGARYGLGIFSPPQARPRTRAAASGLPCGGRYWTPAGDQDGYSTRAGIPTVGRLAVVVSMSTQLRDSLASLLQQERASHTLITRALCGAGTSGRYGDV